MTLLEGLFDTILSIVIDLVNFVLTPIDNLIAKFLPGLDILFGYVSNFFNYISNLIPWAVSYTGLNHDLLNFVVLALIFKVTASFTIYLAKLAVRWYNYLKL